MSSILTTSIPRVYAQSLDATSLVERFCSCPAAKALLTSAQEIKPLLVNLSDQIGSASTKFDFDGRLTTISIPAASSEKTALASFAFEFFNAKESTSLLRMDKQARSGTLGMDAYALSIEKVEHESLLQSETLIDRCKTEWQVPAESPFRQMDPIFNSFYQQVACHTDAYRQQWISRFQASYCAKNPKDIKSCRPESEQNLCNYQKMMKLEKENTSSYYKLISKRTCQEFSIANETTRENYFVKNEALKKCPHLFNTPEPTAHPNNLKIGEFGQEDRQNFRSKQETVAERRDKSENENSEAHPTQSETEFAILTAIAGLALSAMIFGVFRCWQRARSTIQRFPDRPKVEHTSSIIGADLTRILR